MKAQLNLLNLTAEERTPLVDQLIKLIQEQRQMIQEQQQTIEELKDEIRRLKKHKGKPKLRPSALNKNRNKEKEDKKRKRGRQAKPKRPPDNVEKIAAGNIPAGSRFKGYRTYEIQELEMTTKKTRYQLERWQLPDGSYRVANLPAELTGYHFGPQLRAYVLHQHHHQGVTQPLLLAQLQEWGIEIV